jgi:hypothetical protein
MPTFAKTGLWAIATWQTPTEDEALVEQALVENGGAFDAYRF